MATENTNTKITDSPSSDSPALSSVSSSSSLPRDGRAANRSMDYLSWVVVAIITYAWLWTKKLDGVRPEFVLGFFASVVLPGSVLMSLGQSMIDRLVPARGGK